MFFSIQSLSPYSGTRSSQTKARSQKGAKEREKNLNKKPLKVVFLWKHSSPKWYLRDLCIMKESMLTTVVPDCRTTRSCFSSESSHIVAGITDEDVSKDYFSLVFRSDSIPIVLWRLQISLWRVQKFLFKSQWLASSF